MQFSDMLGMTLTSVTEVDDEVIFETTDDRRFKLYHSQDCCESVYVESIVGDLADLIGSPLLQAEEATNEPEPERAQYVESCTWTFYKLATIKGGVTIRFYGESNGYYSESVDFVECR